MELRHSTSICYIIGFGDFKNQDICNISDFLEKVAPRFGGALC